MLGGNKLYEKLKSKNVLSNINLTVPEAVSYAGKNSNIHEWVLRELIAYMSEDIFRFLVVEEHALLRTIAKYLI